VVAGERKTVKGFEPSVIGMASRLAAADLDHVLLLVGHRDGNPSP